MKTKLLILISLAFALHAHAGSATWNLNPTSGDWNTAANWTPATVPDDIATFGASNQTAITVSMFGTEVNELIFNPGASSFNIAADSPSLQDVVTLTISGTGIINNSGVTQNLAAGQGGHGGLIYFLNGASAGDGTTLTAFGANTDNQGIIYFYDTSTAGTAKIVLGGALADGNSGGWLVLAGHASLGNASVTINESEVAGGEGGHMPFNESSSAGNAKFVINSATAPGHGAGSMLFISNATAGNSTFTLNGSTTASGATAEIDFIGIFPDICTAGNGFFTINGGQGAGASGAKVDFQGESGPGQQASAETATLINNGGDGGGSLGGQTIFEEYSTAGQATLIANGGTNGGGGGTITLMGAADGAEARIELFGNGELKVPIGAFVSVGSVEGDGFVVLGGGNGRTTQLTIGANNLSTTFSGLIEGVTGALTKIGTASLTLSGANTYTGGTTIEGGKLVVNNKTGSGTGSGAVQVNAGRLSGGGIISGTVTVGASGGPGATLAPGRRKGKQDTLAIQGGLTFTAHGYYECGLDSKKAITDKVVANGVTINGARFALRDARGFSLAPGTVFTVIDNTAAIPISGLFANLPDNSIFTVGNNTYQASYEGGDGNDLTLTVVH